LSSFCTGNIEHFIRGYQICAASEGKSPNTIAIVTNSVRYFSNFLTSHGLSTDVAQISHHELRAFILYLRQKARFLGHPYNRTDGRPLSGNTVNCYLRSLRAFFSWLLSEGIITENPFARVKIPKAPKKVIATFSDDQIRRLLGVINVKKPEGYRDYCIIMTLLDTAMRVTELCNIRLSDLQLEDGVIKVWGKGNKQRLVPIGKQVQRCLWRYISRYRPELANDRSDFLFVTRDGRPLTKDRIDKIVRAYGKKADVVGVRCSPHTFRHSAAVRFLRNGGDVFSLQRMLGHDSLEMTRRYCELADIDVKRAHIAASPVDNLAIAAGLRPRPVKDTPRVQRPTATSNL